MKITGLVELTLQDYPKELACMLFAAGCNFRCKYCHNGKTLVLNSNPTCIDEDYIKQFLIKRKGKLTAVILSGGEFLNQPDAIDFIKWIKELGYKIKVDTNGCHFDSLKYLIDNKLIDYVAMDIKSSIDNYKEVIGRELLITERTSILSCINLLLTDVVDYEFRTTVPHSVVTPADVKSIGEMTKGAKRYYIQNYVYNMNVIDDNLKSCTKSELDCLKSIMKNYINNIQIRSY